MTRLLEVEGIGPAYATRLEKAGIRSIEALLKEGGSASGRKALAGSSGVDEGKLLEWVNHADLMRIKGVGSEYADLLEAAGVDTVVELAVRNADNLHARMTEVNAAKKLVRRAPSLSETQRWVSQAKALPRAVTH